MGKEAHMPRDANRPRLGRGLASLIRDSSDTQHSGTYEPVAPTPQPQPPAPQQSIQILPLDQIGPNPHQPRRDFDESALAALADSLRDHGLLQPVLVAPVPENQQPPTHRLIAGERRLRAARLAGLNQIPCIVRTSSAQDSLALALIENLHRADLNPIERATGYRELIDRFRLTQQQVADSVGQPRPTVANYLRILDLPDSVQSCLLSGDITLGHAKVLAGLAGRPEQQELLARRCVRERLSVRQLEEILSQVQQEERPGGENQGQTPRVRPPHLVDLERQLTEAVGTRVTIRPGRAKHTGRIVIEYYGLDDFDRAVAALGATLES